MKNYYHLRQKVKILQFGQPTRNTLLVQPRFTIGAIINTRGIRLMRSCEKLSPPKETDNILTGEDFGENPKAIMFPEAEREISQKDDTKLIEFLEYRFGYKFTKRIESIEGRDWTIFTAAD